MNIDIKSGVEGFQSAGEVFAGAFHTGLTTCPDCGAEENWDKTRGWKVGTWRPRHELCDKCEIIQLAKAKAEEAKRTEAIVWTRQNKRYWLQDACVPIEYHHCSIDTFESVGKLKQEKLRESIKSLVYRQPSIILFRGQPGVGKTHLGIAIMREFCIENPHISEALFRFIESSTLGQLIWKLEKYGHIDTLERELHYYEKDCWLLFVDDLGVDNDGGYSNIVKKIIKRRIANRRMTILTTNLTDEQITTQYDGAFLDRLKSDNNVFYTIKSTSYRQREKRQ